MAVREYKGAATPTTITSNITNSATSLTITDATGWPTGSFSFVIDPGLAGEEKVLATSRVGTTVNITTRGYDNTTAASHLAGAIIYPVPTAIDFSEANTLTNKMLGGTTSQVLKKNSATDNDFSWADPAGDITGVTAGTGLTGGGVSGDVTVSIDQTWSGVNARLANPVINGAFDIAQRGTSINPTGAVYTLDRWNCDRVGGMSGSPVTVSRQSVGDTTNLPNIQYRARVQRNSGAGTGAIYFNTPIETANCIPFIGKAVTVSFYVRKGSGYTGSNNLAVDLMGGTGTDQNYLNAWTGASSQGALAINPTTTWTRYAFNCTISASMTELTIPFVYTPTGTASSNDYFEVTGVQIDLGTYTAANAPAFRRAGGTIQGELAACQRYYRRFTTVATYGSFGIGVATTASNVAIPYQLAPMRVAPTSMDYSSIMVTADNLTVITPSSLTLKAGTSTGNTSPDYAWVDIAISGGTQYRPYFVMANNSSSAYIGFSAEL